MSKITCQMSMSIDGYVAGPNQGPENPLGEGGMALHEWAFASQSWREMHGEGGGEDNVDSQFFDRVVAGNGAYVMGRKMFGGGGGEWNLDWNGWWGEDPPYHADTYVLSHHEREPLAMEGGTTFHFVTEGLEAAIERARSSAGELDVSIAGGASVVNQCLAANLIDELTLDVSPVVLGAGERLFTDVGEVRLELIEAVPGERATHLCYRVV